MRSSKQPIEYANLPICDTHLWSTPFYPYIIIKVIIHLELHFVYSTPFFGIFWVLWDFFEGSWNSHWDPSRFFGIYWDYFRFSGILLGILRDSLGLFGIIRDALKFSGILLGILQDSMGSFRIFWGFLGLFLESFKIFLGCFDVFWDSPWDPSRFFGIFWDFLRFSGIFLGILQDSLGSLWIFWHSSSLNRFYGKIPQIVGVYRWWVVSLWFFGIF